MNSFDEVFEAVKEYCTKDGKVGDIARNLWLDTLKPARLAISLAYAATREE